jgi:GNAT superfamily N-acetyltransferase
MDIRIRVATGADAALVEEMLLEAARWVDALGVVMWEEGELTRAEIEAEVASGQFFIAEASDQSARSVRLQPDHVAARLQPDPAGVIRFQLEDTLFWPDIAQEDSAFVHRLVVARRYKGQGISTALLSWAVEHARASGKAFLRLDCDADRVKLRALYEGFGFRFHSFRQVTSYYVARYELPVG